VRFIPTLPLLFGGRSYSRCLSSGRRHACGVVSNVCCDVSAPRGTVFKLSAAPPPKPAIACTSWWVEPFELPIEPVGGSTAKPPSCHYRKNREAIRYGAPRGNPRRLRLRRGGCLAAGPKHRRPDVFHAKIGHRITGLPRDGDTSRRCRIPPRLHAQSPHTRAPPRLRAPTREAAMAALAKSWRRRRADQVFGNRCEAAKLVVAGFGRVGLKTWGGTCCGLRA
jgi:hypothetical protein